MSMDAMGGMAAALTVLVQAKGVDHVNQELEEATMKPGPRKGDPQSKQAGKQGGKSRPSLKKGTHKQGARHAKPRGR